jgi:SAM-dependent methyltransferase
MSSVFGFDRGLPIDRYYIESFLEKNKKFIKGHCLEVHDSAYTIKYGEDRVTSYDAVDVDTSNTQANIYADLADAKNIPDNTYDTLIITHTIGLIPEHEKAIAHLYRILKPGGYLLLTASTMGPFIENGSGFWRYTTKSIPYMLEKHFKKSSITTEAFGNVLTGQAFWTGMAVQDLTKEELDYKDSRFPIVVAAVCQK